MTASLTDYKGLEVVTPAPTGAGGLAIQDNFKKIIDWQYAVIDDTLTAPPGTPVVGDRYIVASPATGDWAGLDNHIAECVAAAPDPVAWSNLAPNVGFPVFVTSKQILYYWDGTTWQPIASGTAGNLAGADTQVQFNNAGVFGADPNFTYNLGASALQVDNISIDGNTIRATDTNGNLILAPNGNGALQADSGGNARGNNAVDLQTKRYAVTAVASGVDSVVAGGDSNTASNLNSVVGGGYANTSSGYYASTVAGGQGNNATGSYSTIGGGVANSASGDFSTVSGGNNSDANAHYTSILGGRNNAANADYTAIPGGFGATARLYGQVTHAAGFFGGDGPGSAQVSTLVARCETESFTASMFLDGSSETMTIPASMAWAYEIHIIARTSDSFTAAKEFFHRGVITSDGTTTVVSDDSSAASKFVNIPASPPSNPNWTTVVTNNGNALDIQVNSNGDYVLWVARIQLTETTSYPAG